MAQAQKVLATNLQDGIDKLKAVFAKKEEVVQAQKDLTEMQNEVGLWGYGEDVYMPYRVERAFETIFGGQSNLAEQAFETLLSEDVNMARQYFQYYRASYTYRQEKKTQRVAAFNCIIGQAEMIWELLGQECFNAQELQVIYNAHSKTFFKKIGKGVLDLYEYCRVFKAYTSNIEKDLLVKRIMGRKKIDLAKKMVNDPTWKLTAEQSGQLDGLMVAEKLRKAR